MASIKLTRVESSNIEALGYDVPSKTLVVLFHNGNSYSYTPITRETYENLLYADSIGKYFNENIKNNKEVTWKKL